LTKSAGGFYTAHDRHTHALEGHALAPSHHGRQSRRMTPTLETIEAAIDQLSLSEQLLLMEHLASRIRSRTLRSLTVDESYLASMANDPAIQRELQQIDAEYSATEADGLGRD
jgi:hypothetical protein